MPQPGVTLPSSKTRSMQFIMAMTVGYVYSECSKLGQIATAIEYDSKREHYQECE